MVTLTNAAETDNVDTKERKVKRRGFSWFEGMLFRRVSLLAQACGKDGKQRVEKKGEEGG